LQCVAPLDLQVEQHYFNSPWQVLHTFVPDNRAGNKLYIATSVWYAGSIEAFVSQQSDANAQARVSALAEAVMAKAQLSVLNKSGTQMSVRPLGPVAAEFWVCERKTSCWSGESIGIGPMGVILQSYGASTSQLDDTEDDSWVFTEFDPSDSASAEE
jgi:hypothetical protein